MLLLKYLLLIIGWGLLVSATTIALNNINKVVQYHRRLRIHIAPEPGLPSSSLGGLEKTPPAKPQLDWTTAKWAFLGAWLPYLPAAGIVVVPSGMGGIRVSQTSGTRPGTLYPGAHWVTPLVVDSVGSDDLRDQILTTSSGKDGLEPVSGTDVKNRRHGAFSYAGRRP